MQLVVRLGLEDVIVLIDSCAIDNHVSIGLVERLNLPHRSNSAVRTKILLGDRNLLSAKGKCEGLTLRLSSDFTVMTDFIVYELLGMVDVNLGSEWLKTLGEVRFNYTDLTMRFELAGNEYCLKGKTGIVYRGQQMAAAAAVLGRSS